MISLFIVFTGHLSISVVKLTYPAQYPVNGPVKVLYTPWQTCSFHQQLQPCCKYCTKTILSYISTGCVNLLAVWLPRGKQGSVGCLAPQRKTRICWLSGSPEENKDLLAVWLPRGKQGSVGCLAPQRKTRMQKQPGGEMWRGNYRKCPSAGARLPNKLQTDRSGEVLFLPYRSVGTKRIK